MIRKHSAKVLTMRNVIRSPRTGEEETLHFVLIGGAWHYNGTSSLKLSTSCKDGFWKDTLLNILNDRTNFSLKELKGFYKGPNKSMQVAMREWTTNQPVYGVPF